MLLDCCTHLISLPTTTAFYFATKQAIQVSECSVLNVSYGALV